jgi:tetratricopeptide (TPR) repeat protein
VEILEKLVSEYEGPPEAFLYLGRALHAVKNYSRSLAAFNDYITLKPRSPEGYFFAGLVFWIFCFIVSRYSLYIERRLSSKRH